LEAEPGNTEAESVTLTETEKEDNIEEDWAPQQEEQGIIADTDQGEEEDNEEDNEDIDTELEEVKKDNDELIITDIPDIDIEEENNQAMAKYHKVIIVLKNRKSSNILTKFEQCEIISIRAQQIANNDIALIDKGLLDDPIDIAKKELMLRKCPLILRRKMGEIFNKEKKEFIEYYEYWDVNQMTFPIYYEGVTGV